MYLSKRSTELPQKCRRSLFFIKGVVIWSSFLDSWKWLYSDKSFVDCPSLYPKRSGSAVAAVFDDSLMYGIELTRRVPTLIYPRWMFSVDRPTSPLNEMKLRCGFHLVFYKAVLVASCLRLTEVLSPNILWQINLNLQIHRILCIIVRSCDLGLGCEQNLANLVRKILYFSVCLARAKLP